jgi:repressor LexA
MTKKLEVIEGGRSNGQALTARQRQILEYIRERVGSDGVPPSYREIGRAFGIKSTNAVAEHVAALVRKGYLTRVGEGRGLARSLALTSIALTELGVEESLAEVLEIPIYGRVAAGVPVLSDENLQGHVQVDSFLLGAHRQVFALRVAGESMIEDGIYDGDFLFVRKQIEVNNGDIAVVMVDGEATVKRFYREGERVRLQPANGEMAPIILRASDLKSVDIIGVVVGVYRRI